MGEKKTDQYNVNGKIISLCCCVRKFLHSLQFLVCGKRFCWDALDHVLLQTAIWEQMDMFCYTTLTFPLR